VQRSMVRLPGALPASSGDCTSEAVELLMPTPCLRGWIPSGVAWRAAPCEAREVMSCQGATDSHPSESAGKDGNTGKPAWRVLLSAVASDPRALIAVIGLVLYAVLRVAYVAFYQPFGLSPDDLGFGYLDLLGQAAVATLVFTALLVVLLWIMIAVILGGIRLAKTRGRLPWEPQEQEDAGHKKTPLWLSVVRFVWTALLFVATLLLVGEFFGLDPLPGVAPYLFSAAGLALVAAAALEWYEGREPRERAWVDPVVATTIFIAFAVVSATLIAQATFDADDVRDGHSRHPTGLGMRLASWGAERATIRWTETDTARRVPGLEGRCVMYFGEANGTVFLYRPGTRDTLRLPASAIVVTIDPPSCRGL
jgi:hypothetical protein